SAQIKVIDGVQGLPTRGGQLEAAMGERPCCLHCLVKREQQGTKGRSACAVCLHVNFVARSSAKTRACRIGGARVRDRESCPDWQASISAGPPGGKSGGCT